MMMNKSNLVGKMLLLLCTLLAFPAVASCGKQTPPEEQNTPAPAETESESETPLPDKYSLVEEDRITEYKNQHQSGMCWAYSAAAAAESSLITDGFEDPSVDLAEGHIVYTVYPFEEDRAEDSLEDGIFISGEKKKNQMIPCYIGGMSSIAAMKFALGEGLIYEEEAPFGTDAGELQKSVANYLDLKEKGEIQKDMGEYLLTKMVLYEDDEAIKRGIMENGAACTGILLDAKEFSRDSDGGACYYHTPMDPDYRFSLKDGPETNHVVTLAGWDDGYSRENFDGKPERDGAWLVKDSISSSLNYRETGYYWMSYEEMHIGTMGMRFEKKADYGTILSYDAVGPTDLIKADAEETVIANVFCTDIDNGVKGVGVFAGVPQQKIRISVFASPDEGCPDSGEKLCEKDVVIDHPGYEVIEMEPSRELSAGETFSVVAAYANVEGEEGIAPVEGDSSIMPPNAMECLYLVSGEGESYAKYKEEWYDLSKKETAELFGKKEIVNNSSIKALMTEGK